VARRVAGDDRSVLELFEVDLRVRDRDLVRLFLVRALLDRNLVVLLPVGEDEEEAELAVAEDVASGCLMVSRQALDPPLLPVETRLAGAYWFPDRTSIRPFSPSSTARALMFLESRLFSMIRFSRNS